MVSYFFNLLLIFLSMVGKKNHCFTATTASEITTPYLKETDSLLWDYCACRGCFFRCIVDIFKGKEFGQSNKMVDGKCGALQGK